MTRRLLHGWVAVLVFIPLAILTRPVRAARAGPEPLLLQLEDGYGIVAAEVVSAHTVSKDGAYPGIVKTVFSVQSVVAQPIGAQEFLLHEGDHIEVRLSVGYACQVENTPLQPGQKYFLTLKLKDARVYEHAQGASALIAVDKFSGASFGRYKEARRLVDIPRQRRIQAWLERVKNPDGSEQSRQDALGALAEYLWSRSSQLSMEEQAGLRSELRKVWNDPASKISIPMAEGLDYALQTDQDFANSSDRTTGWLMRLFAPTPDLRKDDNDRDNLAMGILERLVVARPKEVGRKLVVEMFNQEWPPLYRRAISAALLTGYRQLEQRDPSWEPALQRYYSNGLLREKEPFAIRVMAGDIKSGIQPIPRCNRDFVADAEVRKALAETIGRLAAMPRSLPYDEAGIAIHDCKDTLDALNAQKP